MNHHNLQVEVTKSMTYGSRKFSNRLDFENYFLNKKLVNCKEDVWKNNNYVRTIHKKWHNSGQTGCLFAQSISKEMEFHNWKVSILNSVNKQMIDEEIIQAIEDPEIEIISLLFPTISDEEEYINFINLILECEMIYLEDSFESDGNTSLKLRTMINPNCIAWIMGFAPFDYFPNTRKSPMVEMVIRTKPKHDDIFYKSSRDVTIAHTADIPIYLNEKEKEKLWNATFINTERILGHKPNEFSAARSSFVIPTKKSKLLMV